MTSGNSLQLAAATERLRAETTVSGLIGATARAYIEVLDAPACTISRVIGDLLVDLVQHRQSGTSDRLGHGYLISDYPLTRAVIEQGDARTVSLADPDADPAEARLLRELGFESLVMVAIGAQGGAWGLVEVYGEKGRRFQEEDVARARNLAVEVGRSLRRLEQPELPS